nr:MAG TPA: hypothetical protein [Caudoviricetes sp.]
MKHLLKLLFGKKKPPKKDYFFEVVETPEEKQVVFYNAEKMASLKAIKTKET